jgi:sporulation-control protein
MVFKKMMQKFGVGGPSVDTVLTDPRLSPGDPLTGEIRLTGGDADTAAIEHIALSLVTRAQGRSVDFHRVVVAGQTRLAPKEQRTIPFSVPLPWEAPLTEVGGQPLPGVQLGLRTDVSIAKAVDKGDLDPVFVAPAPAQDSVLDAFGELGCTFKSATVRTGQIYGVRQDLPFFQQFEFYPPGRYAGRVQEIGLILVTTPAGVLVILAAGQPGGTGAGRFQVSHEEAVETDWAGHVSEWLDQLVQSQQAAMTHPGHGQYGDSGQYGGQGQYGPGQYGQQGRQRRGPGMGGIVAGAAAGVVGGMLIGEMLGGGDEGGGDDGGDEG